MGAYPFLLSFLLIQTFSIIPVTKETFAAGDVTLSADGTRLVYTLPGPPGSGQAELWIRDTGTLRGEKMAPPALFERFMVLAPDGKSIYFLARDSAKPWMNHLYQWPLSGGEPKRVA